VAYADDPYAIELGGTVMTQPPREFPRYGPAADRQAPSQPDQPFRAPAHWYLPPPVRTSGLALAALITALCGLGPIAAGLGIAALVSLRTSRLEGFGMAVAAVAIGAVETLLLVVGIAIAVSGEDDPAPTYTPSYQPTYEPPPVPDEDMVYVDDLAAGDCFDEGPEEDEVAVVPCGQPHDGEMVGSVTLGAGAYPGDRGLQEQAERACDQTFATYVGTTVQKTSLRPDFWAPDRELWESGDRVAVCATWGPDGDRLTGSVKGSKR
jgi:Septum formation